METINFRDAWAKRADLPREAAADELARLIHKIIQELRQGQEVRLPGLGTLTSGQQSPCVFEQTSKTTATDRSKS